MNFLIKFGRVRLVLVPVFLFLFASAAQAQMGKPQYKSLPPELGGVRIDQNLNAQVPLDLEFRDESGAPVELSKYFGDKPVILNLVYFECPMLCTEVLNGLTSALRILKLNVGRDFQVLTVSFDPSEKPDLAAAKKKAYLGRYGRSGAEQGWHFLTGEQASITALTNAVGFHYQWDEKTQQFAHASAIMILTPQGKIAQYYYGVEYSPKDLRLGLVEASKNKIGTITDQVLLYCYHYDPRTGKYGAVVTNMMRLGGATTIAIVGAFLLIMFSREHRVRKNKGQAK